MDFSVMLVNILLFMLGMLLVILVILILNINILIIDRYLLCLCFFFDLYVIFILIWNKLMYGDGWMGCYIYYIF